MTETEDHDIPLTDEVPENELEAEPDHIGLDEEGNPDEA